MFGSYVTSAVRALQRDPWHAAVNMLGLAVALAASLLILLYVRHELSYEDFFTAPERVFRVEAFYDDPGQPSRFPTSPYPIPELLDGDFGDRLTATRLAMRPAVIGSGDVRLRERLFIADERFLDVLDLPIVAGDGAAALREPGRIVVSESMARRLFGDAPAVGRTLRVNDEIDLQVGAIVRDPPGNTDLVVNLLASIATPAFAAPPDAANNWRRVVQHTYVRLEGETTAEAIAAQLPAFVARHKPPEAADRALNLRLRPLRETHLVSGSPRINLTTAFGDANRFAIAALTATGVFLLFIACFSYINLATARSFLRLKEVGLRKIVGGRTEQLALQFFAEAAMITAMAFVLALGLAAAALPAFARLVDRELALADLATPGFLASALCLLAAVSAAAGAYPALVLASRKPVELFQMNKGSAGASGFLRVGVVGAQFSLTVAMLIVAGVVVAQLAYLRAFDLGVDKRGLHQLVVFGDLADDGRGTALFERLSRSPHVEGVTRASVAFRSGYERFMPLLRSEDPDASPLRFRVLDVDKRYFDVMGLPTIAGRSFDEDSGADEMRLPSAQTPVEQSGIVLTESAASTLGYASPQAAIGERVTYGVEPGRVEFTIVGVVQDFHLRLGREPLAPIVFTYAPTFLDLYQNEILVRAREGQTQAARDDAQAIWSELFGADFMSYSSVDEVIANVNLDDDRRSALLAFFAGLGLFVSCLGLFALASFVAARRAFEVAVRKVLGASTLGVTRLLMWDFAKPVLLANVVAWPSAYALVSPWLARFPYHIDLSPAYFVGASALSLAVAMTTVFVRTFRTARLRPVLFLRAE